MFQTTMINSDCMDYINKQLKVTATLHNHKCLILWVKANGMLGMICEGWLEPKQWLSTLK